MACTDYAAARAAWENDTRQIRALRAQIQTAQNAIQLRQQQIQSAQDQIATLDADRQVQLACMDGLA